jgi:hypothetical protein
MRELTLSPATLLHVFLAAGVVTPVLLLLGEMFVVELAFLEAAALSLREAYGFR